LPVETLPCEVVAEDPVSATVRAELIDPGEAVVPKPERAAGKVGVSVPSEAVAS
jgi:hypothetical protein